MMSESEANSDGNICRKATTMDQVHSLKARKHLGSGPLGEKFDDAFLFASQHQRKQMRKSSNVPYLSHLMSVSALVLEHGGSEHQAIAGLLHDAVEDAPVGQGPAVLDKINEDFGDEVTAIVRSCSDGLDNVGNRAGTWAQRKRPYVAHLADKTEGALLVTAADKTHNARCIAADVRTYGSDFWKVFNACTSQLLWYYAAVESGVQARLPGSTIAVALHAAVDELFGAAGVRRDQVSAELPTCGCERHTGCCPQLTTQQP
jgi:(p)ppGpp synthase/HD superfamily hydrolase